jgi:FkbM family methyltransferase
VQQAIEAHPGIAAAVVAARALSGETGDRVVAWVAPTAPYAPAVDGFARYPYGDLVVAGLNQHETAFLCGEVFERLAYLRHGLSVPDGACVFDVGANIGLFSLQAHLCARGVRIVAFEPNPEACRCLHANARIFGMTGQFLNVGAGSRAGDADLTVYRGFSLFAGFHADRDADLAIVREFVRQQRPRQTNGEREWIEDLLAARFEARRERRPITTISNVIREHGVEVIDLLKINVEKSEADVLAGIDAGDWPKIHQVALEVHDVGGRLDAIAGLLERRGFAVATEPDWSFASGPRNHYVYASRNGLGHPAVAGRRPAVVLPAPLTAHDLKSALAARLSAHEVPARIVVLERLPLTSHGKVDREALDACLAEQQARERPEPPRTPLEAQLLGAWREILAHPAVGVDTSFLDAGGDSFSIMQLNLRLHRLLGVDLPVVDMFRHPSIRQLAAHLTALAPERRAVDAAPRSDLT